MAEPVLKDQAAVIGPVVEKLITMMGAARDAFNRHSRASLEELKRLQGMAQEVGKSVKQAALPAKVSEAEKGAFRRMQSILHHLQLVGDNIGALADPIHRKIKDGILFSDKAVSQINYLFDHHTGMLRSVTDILKTGNEFLKKYVAQEGRNLIQSCSDFATEHESRMIEGVCLPQAAPIFLTILDHCRALGQHEVDIAGILARKG